MLVRVLAAVLVHAHALERAEDGVGPVVCGEVVGVFGELRAVVVEVALRGAELVAGVGDAPGFGGVGVGVGEDTVLDEGDAEGAELLVNPGAQRGGEVFFEFVDCQDC